MKHTILLGLVSLSLNSIAQSGCLMAHFPFNGNATDVTGLGHDGTITGATPATDRNGIANACYQFDGVDDFIQLNGSWSGSDGTIAAWIYVDDLADYRPIFSRVAVPNTGNALALSIDPASSIDPGWLWYGFDDRACGGHLYFTESTPQPPVGQWVHVGVTAGGDSVRLFLNGVKISSITTGYSQANPGKWFSDLCAGTFQTHVGMSFASNSTGYFKGRIDDLRIYNCALDANEMAILGEAAPIRIAAKALLEGGLRFGTTLMGDELRAAGLIPTAEPYTGLGYPVLPGAGGESTTVGVLAVTGNNSIVDWVRVELRSALDPSAIVSVRHALLQRDGDVVSASDGVSPVLFETPAGNYFVAVRHRNHLACMTSAAVTLVSTPTVIDFSDPSTSCNGMDARKDLNGTMVLWAGNTTPNGNMKYTGSGNDRDPILFVIGGAIPTATLGGYRTEDVNLDGQVKYTGGTNDRDMILLNIGGSVPTNVRVEQIP